MKSRVAIILGLSLAGSLLSAFPVSAQGFRSDDPVIRAMWQEGMEQSQTEPLAQMLMDYIGPRLSGTPGTGASTCAESSTALGAGGGRGYSTSI